MASVRARDGDAKGAGGFDPVPGDLLLGGAQRDLAIAYGVVERVLDGVFRVRYRARFDLQIEGVVVATELERHEVVKLAGYVVLAVRGLGDVPFEGFGLRFGRAD
jgi:type IV secretory pathway TrbD component